MLLRNGKTYNKAIVPDKKEIPKDTLCSMDKCYILNYIKLSKFNITTEYDISYYENRLKEPSDNKQIQVNTMHLALNLVDVCPVNRNTDPINRIYNRLYWVNEIFKYFLKAEHLKRVKKLTDVIKSRLNVIQYKETSYRQYDETLNYFIYVCAPIFEKLRLELRNY